MTPVGLGVVALVIVANSAGAVGFGISGNALVVTTGVALYVLAAVVFLLWTGAPDWLVAGLLLTMAVAAAITHHGDPTSSGGIGLYLGMAFAPLRLPVRRAAVVSIMGVLIFDAQLLAEAANPGVFILVVNGGAVFFFLLGLLLRREGEQRAEVTRLLEELRASREAEKVAAAMAERSRLAREMHDVLAHTLSGLVLQLEGLKLLASARDTDEAVTDGLARAHRLSQTGLTEARQAITALRGGTVPGAAAIADLVAEHRALTGQPCRFLEHGPPRPVAADIGLALYRTAQEALSNVRKHAPEADVDVDLHWEQDHVHLVVEDTGLPVKVGMQQPSESGETPGYGLTGMAERAGLAGGRLEARPTERGFQVDLRLPAPGGSS